MRGLMQILSKFQVSFHYPGKWTILWDLFILITVTVGIGVFHGVAGVARATPGLMELPSTGKGSEVSR